jgi:CDP-diacylglycerol---serine O-phosphatidyltransferase
VKNIHIIHNKQNVKLKPAPENRFEQRHKAIYLLPNAFTTAALFCGFYAIMMTIQGHYSTAIQAIFYAMLLDGLDGRVARLTHTQSTFGEQYDSLSDVIAFGVAPATLAYLYSLQHLGKWGMAISFIFCACGALRLARFNSSIGQIHPSYFQGLPIPAASAALISMIAINIHYPEFFVQYGLPTAKILSIWMLYLAISMVSNLPFYSGKTLGFASAASFKLLVIGLILFAIIMIEPILAMAVIIMLYALSGLIWRLIGKARGKKNPVFMI